jgi:hypothetical protein
MKRAFVIRLSPDTNPAKGKFQGHVEEVDTGRELKFRSVEEFLRLQKNKLEKGLLCRPGFGALSLPICLYHTRVQE